MRIHGWSRNRSNAGQPADSPNSSELSTVCDNVESQASEQCLNGFSFEPYRERRCFPLTDAAGLGIFFASLEGAVFLPAAGTGHCKRSSLMSGSSGSGANGHCHDRANVRSGDLDGGHFVSRSSPATNVRSPSTGGRICPGSRPDIDDR